MSLASIDVIHAGVFSASHSVASAFCSAVKFHRSIDVMSFSLLGVFGVLVYDFNSTIRRANAISAPAVASACICSICPPFSMKS